jgi:mRNA-degrading endonuclease RelE of RelBE toxin-antitoxin system
MGNASRVVFNEYGLGSFLKLPPTVQKQVLKKVRQVIGAAPETAGYPLKRELVGFRSIHINRYRIVWRVLMLANGESIAEISYVGIRAEGDKQRDTYAEVQKVLSRYNLP